MPKPIATVVGQGTVGLNPPRGIAAEETEQQGEEFPFPSDRGGPLLARLLSPPEKGLPPLEVSATARRVPGPAVVENPRLQLPPWFLEPPRMPSQHPVNVVRVRPAAEAPLLADSRGDRQAPPRQPFPTGPGTRLPSFDVNLPVPLPILAKPLPDRAPLDDPTLAASAAAALAAPLPVRTDPAPFVRFNLPDPFENRTQVRLRTAPAEDPTPVAPTHRRPKP